jgi:hypothetical protein
MEVNGWVSMAGRQHNDDGRECAAEFTFVAR